MASQAMVAFPENETALAGGPTNNKCVLEVYTLADSAPVTPGAWVLSGGPDGLYSLLVPGVTVPCRFYIYKIGAESTVNCPGTIGDEFAVDAVTADDFQNILTQYQATISAIVAGINDQNTSAIAASIAALRTKLDIMTNNGNVFSAAALANTPSVAVVGGAGTGSLEFDWWEFAEGHPNEPEYAIPDTTVVVYNNNEAQGDIMASGVTDELGHVRFFLDAGTYYVFRRKAGRTFTNPVEILVS